MYRAIDTKLKRQVALKILPPALQADSDRLARFQREAEVLASVNHPNIAIIHGLAEAEGVTALVMELVEGEDLSQRIAHGAIPLDEALPIARQIAEALEAAHEQGIIHRDLKPANIKVRSDGTVKVLDFGLAKAMDSGLGAGDPRLAHASQAPTITTPAMMTGVGMILGTAAYMSPEQAKGRAVDKRADIWAFGAVLFEMLTGKRAFGGDDVSDTLANVLKMEPALEQLPAEVPARIRQVIRGCLQKNAKQRIGDVQDVRLALEGAFETESTVRASTPTPPSPAWWRRALVPATALIVGAAIAGGVVWVATRPTPPRVVRTEIATAGPAELSVNGTDRDLAITPDGSRIVYRGVNQLLVRALDQPTPTVLTGLGAAHGPFVSPDGQWVGFFDGQNQLRKVAITGGPPVTVATVDGPPRGATWSDSGMLIYATDGPSGLQRVSAAGGDATVLTTPNRDGGEGDHRWPEFLPGGQAVLFTITPPTGSFDNAQIAVLDLRTNTQTVLLRGGHHAHYVPTGHLVYGAGSTLRAVTFDPARLEVRGTPVPVAEQVLTTPSGSVDAVMAANGTLVYLSGIALTSDDQALTIVDRDGTRQRLNARPGPYRSPSVSPDGARVALQSVDANGQSAIWVYDLSGSTAIRQLRGEGNNIRPLWTPDGRRVTFASDRDGPMSLYWQLADGSGEAERLTRAEAGTEHWPESWSPDGRTLAYTDRKAPDGAVWTLSLDQPDMPELFADAAGLQNGAAFAPDGRWLAYTTQESSSGPTVIAGADIYIQPFPPTGAKYPITRADRGEGGAIPHWSPDGRTLFYRRPTVGNQVFAVDIDTASGVAFSNERPLNIRGFSIVQFFRDYDIMRDSRFVMLFPSNFDESREAPRPRMHIVLNWFEELKRLVPTN